MLRTSKLEQTREVKMSLHYNEGEICGFHFALSVIWIWVGSMMLHIPRLFRKASFSQYSNNFTDYEVKACLYNKISDHCEDSQDAAMSLKRSGRLETKLMPKTLHFSTQSMIYALQVSMYVCLHTAQVLSNACISVHVCILHDICALHQSINTDNYVTYWERFRPKEAELSNMDRSLWLARTKK